MPPPSERAVRYHRSGLRLWAFGQLWAIGIPVAIFASGLASRVRNLARRAIPWGPGATAVAVVLFLAILFAANFPLRFYAGYVRPHEYGLSIQGFGRWLGNVFKGLGVTMAVAAAIVPGLYALIARSPGRWWLYAGLLSIPFAAAGAWLVPLVVDPLFHDFAPLQSPQLEAKIDALARKAGIDDAPIFQVDMSRDTTTVNAYVTGLFGSKRIVLWDTLFPRFTDDQILAIMGHEMGHYVLHHVAVGVCLSGLGAIAVLFVVDRAARRVLHRLGPRLGIGGLADEATLPLLYALTLAAMLLADPIALAVSRYQEHEADRFALEITRDNFATASAFLNFQRDNLSIPYPDPVTRIWRSSHPSLGERIEFSNDYRPWATGQPLKYGGLFRDP